MEVEEIDWKRPRGYQDLIEAVSHYNTRLTVERAAGCPYVDGQTGIAMIPTDHLSRSKHERMPGFKPGQVYSYKPRDWMVQYPVTTILDIGHRKKRKANHSRSDTHHTDRNVSYNYIATSSKGPDPMYSSGSPYTQRGAGYPVAGRRITAESNKRKLLEVSRDESEPSDPDESVMDSEEPSSEEEDVRRTKGVMLSGRGGMSRGGMGRKCKCIYCGKYFKNPTSLKTHYTKEHPGQSTSDLNMIHSGKLDVKVLRDTEAKANKNSSKEIKAKANQQCDFCTEVTSPKKTEKLVSCADCGRSAHPSCLTFGPKIALNVQTYRWQCLECKECIICGRADNDEKLLFCDYCDRGYHMYCLSPPMNSPPEGVWICVLCQAKEDQKK
ncbi:Zinc finger protein ubi-d4-like [Oopsacas minuta]|uniref:Zinc finger protein ubi-d4-like n=1 Tax=Oopsacas minuta TaxID=111878 RepID=A0AAV7K8W8_9METZ|nr:Zinc finger protein ubi-d4-like [Oopsacas minuta]